MIDATTGALLDRSSGPIYVPENTKREMLNFFKESTLTALQELADQKKLFHLLRSGSTPGFASLRKDSSSNCYGPKGLVWTELPTDRALNTRCIVIPMHETDRTNFRRPADPRILLGAEKLQEKFLQLSRDLYEALVYPIADDEKLCGVLAWLISKQEQFTREPLSLRQVAVLTALVATVHSPHCPATLVAEVAAIANRFLANGGENLRLTPHAVGDVLTSFGIHNRKRTNKGWTLTFDQDLSKKIHLLIKRYGADCNIASVSLEASPNCPFCKDLVPEFCKDIIVGVAPRKG